VYLKKGSLPHSGTRSFLFVQVTLDSYHVFRHPVYSNFEPRHQLPSKHNQPTFHKILFIPLEQQDITMAPPPRPTGIWLPHEDVIIAGSLEEISHELCKPIEEVETVLSIGRAMGIAGRTNRPPYSPPTYHNINTLYFPAIIRKYDEIYGKDNAVDNLTLE
jgi:hypothetical protein